MMFSIQQMDIEQPKDLLYDEKRIYLLGNFSNVEHIQYFSKVTGPQQNYKVDEVCLWGFQPCPLLHPLLSNALYSSQHQMALGYLFVKSCFLI